jgi:hypothetical protein
LQRYYQKGVFFQLKKGMALVHPKFAFLIFDRNILKRFSSNLLLKFSELSTWCRTANKVNKLIQINGFLIFNSTSFQTSHIKMLFFKLSD